MEELPQPRWPKILQHIYVLAGDLPGLEASSSGAVGPFELLPFLLLESNK